MLITYLPLPTFKDSAKVLTDEDLRLSLINSINILNHNRTLEKIGLGLIETDLEDDPFARMWRGYEGTLKLYAHTFLNELRIRDQEIGVLEKELEKFGQVNLDNLPPWFFGLDEYDKRGIMSSHQTKLIRKNHEHYKTVFGHDGYWPRHPKFHFPPSSKPTVDPILKKQ